MKRFVVIVLDGFGIGAMDDAVTARPGDEKANTLRSILRDHPDMKLPNLERLGLMNAYGAESSRMKMWEDANFGKSELMHFGADTFMGHQEIMGTFPRKPDVHPFQEKVDAVAGHLREQGHKVEIIEREGLRYVLCDDFVTVADNLEADLGMCYNVTAPLDYIPFEKEYEIGRLVREVVTVGRVIVFGGTGNSMEDLWNAEETKDHAFIGIASAKSRSYEQGYQCLHLGYGVDKNVQAPTILTDAGIPVTLIGKVADIVANDKGTSISKRVWSTPSMPSDTWRQGSSVPMCRRPTWPAIPSLHLSIDRSWKQQTAASENCFPFSPRRMCFWLWLTMEMTRTSGTANIRGSVFPFWCTGRELPEKGWVSGNPFPMWAQACAIISG